MNLQKDFINKNPLEIQQILKTILSQNSVVDIFDDPRANHALLKSEKLFYAGALLLAHIKNDNELKQEFLSRLKKLRESLLTSKYRQALLEIRDLMFYLDLIYFNSLISQLNFQVYKKALIDLFESVKQLTAPGLPDTEFSVRQILAPELFANQTNSHHNSILPQSNTEQVQSQTLTNSSQSLSPTSPDMSETTWVNPGASFKSDADTLPNQDTANPFTSRPSKTTRASLKTKARSANRKAIILEVLAEKKQATINEIAEHIKGVSIKTIQRELNQLVQENLIKKIGAKRWTKYTII